MLEGHVIDTPLLRMSLGGFTFVRLTIKANYNMKHKPITSSQKCQALATSGSFIRL